MFNSYSAPSSSSFSNTNNTNTNQATPSIATSAKGLKKSTVPPSSRAAIQEQQIKELQKEIKEMKTMLRQSVDKNKHLEEKVKTMDNLLKNAVAENNKNKSTRTIKLPQNVGKALYVRIVDRITSSHSILTLVLYIL